MIARLVLFAAIALTTTSVLAQEPAEANSSPTTETQAATTGKPQEAEPRQTDSSKEPDATKEAGSEKEKQVDSARDTEPVDSNAEAADPRLKEVKLLEIEKNVVKFTNQERARYGLPPLEIDADLMKSARDHAIWMTRFRRLQHTRMAVAENIAVGYPDSRAVVRGWMGSSGHRANILNRSHGRIGVAAYVTEGGTIYWCQQFRR